LDVKRSSCGGKAEKTKKKEEGRGGGEEELEDGGGGEKKDVCLPGVVAPRHAFVVVEKKGIQCIQCVQYEEGYKVYILVYDHRHRPPKIAS
jgi:hypothetical protein